MPQGLGSGALNFLQFSGLGKTLPKVKPPRLHLVEALISLRLYGPLPPVLL
jgi:hypothetical protein